MIPNIAYFALSGGGTDDGSFANLLQVGTQVLTWIITSMGALADFVVSKPIVLIMFILMLISFVGGYFFRIWRSTGV